MENYSLLIDFVKYSGGAGIIALIWWFYHKSTTDYLNKIFEQQIARDKENSQNLNKIIEQHAGWQDRNFQLLQDMINSNLLQNEKLQEIKTKIENNMWCPFWRSFAKQGNFNIENIGGSDE